MMNKQKNKALHAIMSGKSKDRTAEVKKSIADGSYFKKKGQKGEAMEKCK